MGQAARRRAASNGGTVKASQRGKRTETRDAPKKPELQLQMILNGGRYECFSDWWKSEMP